MLSTAISLLLAFGAVHARPAPGPDGRIVSLLRDELVSVETGLKPARELLRNPMLQLNESGELRVFVRVHEWDETIEEAIEDRGAAIIATAPEHRLLEVLLPLGSIRDVAEVPAVRRIRPVYPAIANSGSVVTQGDAILRADVARRRGYDGAGVVVGAISDGVAGLADAQQTGDLPSVGTMDPGYGAEGTALLEIVHDLAPGAELHFASGIVSELQMRNNILRLADIGCRVIVDDVSYYEEPMFRDGMIAQAIDSVERRGVVYCTSAGNSAEYHYRGTFTDGDTASSLHAWDAVSDTGMQVVVRPGVRATFALHWDEDYGAAATDYDLYLCDEPELTTRVATSADPQDGSGDPVEVISWENSTDQDRTLYVAVERYAGDALPLELFAFNAGHMEYRTFAGSLTGHSRANGAISVAAMDAAYADGNEVERFSARGPVRVEGEVRLKPDLTAVDGVAVTGSGGFPTRFYGTSASAPHVAGVAALLLDAHSDWGPADVRDALVATAHDRGEPGWDGAFGWGLIDAYAALGTAAAGTTAVSGSTGGVTWTAEEGPYRVVGEVTVESGDTLSIEPGVDVLLSVDAHIRIAGALHAVGTQSDSVRFLLDPASEATEWGGLRFTSGDSSTLEYVRVSGAVAEGGHPDYLGGAVIGHSAHAPQLCPGGQSRHVGGGGGLYAREGALVALHGCTIRGNVATNSAGGIRVAFCPDTTRIIDCDISGNRALYGQAGGVALLDAPAVIVGTQVIGNTAPSSGGGVLVEDADVRIEGCRISGNESGESGGGLAASGALIDMHGSHVVGNSAGTFGGGINLLDTDALVAGCIVAGNTAISNSGGGMQVTASPAELANCTIVGNSSAAGGGVSVHNASVACNSSIVWANSPNQVAAVGGDVLGSYSFVQNGGGGGRDEDPLLDGDYALLPGSPCIDAGDPDGPLDPDATRNDAGATPHTQSGVPVWAPIPDVAVVVADEVSFTVSAVDPNSLPLAYWFVRVPEGALFDVVDRRFSWRPHAPGLFVAEFSADNGAVRVFKRVRIFVKASDLTGLASEGTPSEFSLSRPAPNPFNAAVTFQFATPEAVMVSMVVYNTSGQAVRSTVDDSFSAGRHAVVWDGRDDAGRAVASGVYIVRLTAGAFATARRVTLLR